MKGDFSRLTFDPARQYSGVLMQQGRVQLDADWNEQVEIGARRAQVGALDVLGQTAGTAVAPAAMPDSFKVVVAGGALSVLAGRVYVDGLLAENRDAEPTRWDPALAELRGTGAVPYTAQPCLPDPPPLPAEYPYVVYLDVWQREVSYVEVKELVDAAVGVDTAVRRQTVWQVKVLPKTGAVTCATPLDAVPGWDEETRPPAARLSTRPGPPTDDDNPCLVPPAAGYTGLENQLYRVEIHREGSHQGSGAEPATFKWSRDNATLASGVATIAGAGNSLVVDSVGRDDVLRFDGGDWVEVTDERRELRGEPGELRRIVPGGVDVATRTIRLAQPLPLAAPNGFPVDAQGRPTRPTRVRRWDHGGLVRRADRTTYLDLNAPGATGDIPVPPAGTELLLEDNILVQFHLDPGEGPGPGEFRTGDAWCFAARASDAATVEKLDRAPPRAIHHHYARLAVVTGPDTAEDCRVVWPPAVAGAGCCTEVVRPGQNIQAAIDRLPPGGGCVCLKTGEHVVQEPLRIERPNVTLHGESPGAVVRGAGRDPLLTVGSPDGATIEGVTVAGIRWAAAGAVDRPGEHGLLEFRRAAASALRHCTVGPADEQARLFPALGVLALDCTDLDVEGNTLDALLGGVGVGGASGRVRVVGNRIRGPTTTLLTDTPAAGRVETTVAAGLLGVWLLEDVVGPCAVDRNLVSDYSAPVRVGPRADVTSVCGNEVFHTGVRPAGRDTAEFAVDVAAGGALVRDNEVRFENRPLWRGAIRVTAPNARVEANVVRGPARWAQRPPYGVLLAPGGDGDVPTLPNGGLVRANVLEGALVGVSVVGSARVPVADVQVLDNHVAGPAELSDAVAHRGVEVLLGTRCAVAGNRLRDLPAGVALVLGADNRVAGNALTRVREGVTAREEVRLRVEANVVDATLLGAASSRGIAGDGLFDSVVRDNVVAGAQFGVGLGPSVAAPVALPTGESVDTGGRGGRDNRIAENRTAGGLAGAVVSGESGPTVTGNDVRGALVAGILVVRADEVTLAHNRVVRCGAGAPDTTDVGSGILVVSAQRRVAVHACEVRETGLAEDGRFAAGQTHAILVGAPEVRLSDNLVVRARVGPEALPTAAVHRAITAHCDTAEVVGNAAEAMGGGPVIAVARIVTVANNQQVVAAGDRITFANNRCTHVRDANAPVRGPTVILGARRLSLVGNQVSSNGDSFSFGLRTTATAMPPFFISAVGNLTSGPWDAPGTEMRRPNVYADHNVIGVI